MSSIEWTDQTWNPVVGCTPVSPGCLNCYAAAMAMRQEAMGTAAYAPRETGEGRTIRIAERKDGRAVFTGDVRQVESQLDKPAKVRRPTTFFIASMGDLFHEDVPFDYVDRVVSVMRDTPQHRYMVLTKRPDRMRAYFSWMFDRSRFWPYNVALGTSVESERYVDRIRMLAESLALRYFVSFEPLLGPLGDIRALLDRLADNAGSGRVQAIFGGESGPGARPCDLDQMRDAIRQCDEVEGVRVFVKQLGAAPDDAARPDGIWLNSRKGNDMAEWPEDLRRREPLEWR